MNDLSHKLENLSPEKRKLLALTLRKQGRLFNSFPVSFAQQRLWFLDQWAPGNPVYLIAFGIRMSGPLHTLAVRRGLQEIVRRHEILRTIFVPLEGQPVQIIQPPPDLPLPVVDLRS